jgi:hypothetical protein
MKPTPVPEAKEAVPNYCEAAPCMTPYDRRVGGALTLIGGPRFGWFVGIRAAR